MQVMNLKTSAFTSFIKENIWYCYIPLDDWWLINCDMDLQDIRIILLVEYRY